MRFIRDAIFEASNIVGCPLTQRDSHEAAAIRKCIEERYASIYGNSPLWERLRGEIGVYDPDGWKAIGSFPFDDVVVIFFDEEDEVNMYNSNNLKQLEKILSECPGFVFYVTDEKCRFLICCNDHDYVIGAGLARNWVKNLSPRDATLY